MKIIGFLLFMFIGIQANALPKSPVQGTDPGKALETPGSGKILNDLITVLLKTIRTYQIPSHNLRQHIQALPCTNQLWQGIRITGRLPVS